jgi:hypothetical protein
MNGKLSHTCKPIDPREGFGKSTRRICLGFAFPSLHTQKKGELTQAGRGEKEKSVNAKTRRKKKEEREEKGRGMSRPYRLVWVTERLPAR